MSSNGYRLDTIGAGVVRLVMDLPGKVNVMNDDFLAMMNAVLDDLESRGAALKGLVLTSAKNTFLAGGDLSLMGRACKGEEAALFAHFERLKSYLRRIEKLGVPTVAALNGTALGGGYELALACHRRIGLVRPGALVGLPEIGFAILPGAGGVVRLTGLIGLERALDYLLSGRKVDMVTALRDGLVDELAVDEASLQEAALSWIAANPKPSQPWDRPRALGSHLLSPAARGALVMAPFQLAKAGDGDPLAARRILEIATESTFLAVDAALRVETRGLVELMVRPEAAARIEVFFEAGRKRQTVPAAAAVN
jgi:3-hydroxyacyl-CoA dehydrogenase/enoyl-CoA hydratase/3-hydroxybutyryl-CoA epimerase